MFRLSLAISLWASAAIAGEADVVGARATQAGDGSWRFDVSVAHEDEGWEHYANAWRVYAPDGTLLGERILLHPHESEQPFTRSQSGIEIDPLISEVIIRASDLVHEEGGKELRLTLPR